jgi:hypothetical protein
MRINFQSGGENEKNRKARQDLATLGVANSRNAAHVRTSSSEFPGPQCSHPAKPTCNTKAEGEEAK